MDWGTSNACIFIKSTEMEIYFDKQVADCLAEGIEPTGKTYGQRRI